MTTADFHSLGIMQVSMAMLKRAVKIGTSVLIVELMILVAMPETPPPLDASIVLSSRLTVVVSQCENSKLLVGTLITFSRLSLANSSAEKLPHSVSVTVEVDEIVVKNVLSMVLIASSPLNSVTPFNIVSGKPDEVDLSERIFMVVE